LSRFVSAIVTLATLVAFALVLVLQHLPYNSGQV